MEIKKKQICEKHFSTLMILFTFNLVSHEHKHSRVIQPVNSCILNLILHID